MGWFDYFFGPLSPDKYAAAMLRELKRQGDARAWRYDAERFRLVIGLPGDGPAREPLSWNLGNFYEEYRAAPRAERENHLRATVRRILSISADVPVDFDVVRAHLRPKVWVRGGLERTRLQARLDAANPTDPPVAVAPIEIGEHLRGGLVYDLPHAVMSLSDEHLSGWGVSFYEAMEIAVANLAEAGAAVAQAGGLHVFVAGDSYDASRLLVRPVLEQLNVKGRMIAAAPVRDLLLVAGEDDDQTLAAMIEAIEKVADEPRGMSPIPVVLDGDDWLDWRPPGDRPYAKRFDDLRLRFLWSEHEEQKKLLEAHYEKSGIDRFVASYSVVEDVKRGNRFSYAVWPKGVETLLPRADRIALTPDSTAKSTVFVEWETLQGVVGDRLNDAGLYPARYLADFFPTDEEFARLKVEERRSG